MPSANVRAMNTPVRGHRALRRGRTSTAGQIYFVTFTTEARRPWCLAADSAMAAARALHAHDGASRSTLLCWVLMPDHWHGLLQMADDDDLSRWVLASKSRMAKACNRALRRTGAVWARAFHDHALRDDEDLLRVARYLVANPVRAGLVSRLGDYPYWDAVWL